MMLGPGIEPGPHWWEASTLTTAPILLPYHELEGTAPPTEVNHNVINYLCFPSLSVHQEVLFHLQLAEPCPLPAAPFQKSFSKTWADPTY